MIAYRAVLVLGSFCPFHAPFLKPSKVS